MAQYTITITIDEGQDKVLRAKAAELEKAPETVLTDLSSSIIDQIDQWIRDRITEKLGALTPADSLARLEYFDK